MDIEKKYTIISFLVKECCFAFNDLKDLPDDELEFYYDTLLSKKNNSCN